MVIRNRNPHRNRPTRSVMARNGRNYQSSSTNATRLNSLLRKNNFQLFIVIQHLGFGFSSFGLLCPRWTFSWHSGSSISTPFSWQFKKRTIYGKHQHSQGARRVFFEYLNSSFSLFFLVVNISADITIFSLWKSDYLVIFAGFLVWLNVSEKTLNFVIKSF